MILPNVEQIPICQRNIFIRVLLHARDGLYFEKVAFDLKRVNKASKNIIIDRDDIEQASGCYSFDRLNPLEKKGKCKLMQLLL